MRPILLIFPMCLALASAGAGAANEVAAENGRYAMTPTADGFLRLDTRTGAVSLCTATSAGVACRPSADERQALQDEIDRLARDNASLRQQVGQAPSRYGIPSDKDVDQALGVAERWMKRFMDFLRDDPARSKT